MQSGEWSERWHGESSGRWNREWGGVWRIESGVFGGGRTESEESICEWSELWIIIESGRVNDGEWT